MRIELTNEREQLVGDIKGHRVEIESVYRLNKEFRAKIKRLESLLYGKNIANNKFKWHYDNTVSLTTLRDELSYLAYLRLVQLSCHVWRIFTIFSQYLYIL